MRLNKTVFGICFMVLLVGSMIGNLYAEPSTNSAPGQQPGELGYTISNGMVGVIGPDYIVVSERRIAVTRKTKIYNLKGKPATLINIRVRSTVRIDYVLNNFQLEAKTITLIANPR